MAVISATEHRVLHVPAEPREVYDFFSRPERLREAMSSVERCEVLSEGRVRWVLDEKADAGIRFRADYVVAYDGDGAGHVRWRFVEGNMRNEGDVRILPRPDGGSEIRY
ncbi:MAG TPA: SRPBCC family protein, partial [Planctomycetaceae bacterium]